MNAELFHGESEHPVIIDTADDGTRLKDCRGWMCDGCGTLFADKGAAEVCCLEPDTIAES